ncbi:NERD domain-containing protein [Mammaliicoccus lentus]|uniref:nuclease-related domain-containing protein n=1 Tax=Mammaliicoccus lentus TaxID=42858 RepID=UPI00214B3D6E|nr:nuclease-related domain-containing protein [Mammaliicoccus lentus]MCR1873582.1 NERD domain-containing protein [Mammaliicoccus lentus]
MNLQKPLIINYVDALRGRIDKIPDQLEELYAIWKQGYIGEKEFSEILNEQKSETWLHDLQFKNYNQVQLDFIVVTDEAIIQFEIKNYTGDYYYENGKLFRSTGYVAKDLIHQFEVSDETLKRIVKKYKIDRKVISYIVFINPTFTLYGDLRSRINILLYSELHKLKDMFGANFKYDENVWICKKLKSLHQPFITSYLYFEKVEFSKVIGGLKCISCNKIIEPSEVFNVRKYVKCKKCGTITSRHSIIIQSLKELYLLKGEPFSINEAEKWTGVSNSAIKRILYKNFKRIGNYKNSKYVDEDAVR